MHVTKLTKELSYSVIFFSNHVIIQDLYSEAVLGIGKEAIGLYLFGSSLKPSYNLQTSSKLCIALLVWHMHFDNAPLHVLCKLLSANSFEHDNKVVSNCSICPLDKLTRFPFLKSSRVSACMFDLIHMDVWGPYSINTHDNKRYFLKIVDDFSENT